MKRTHIIWLLAAGLVLLAALYQLPWINYRLSWRVDAARAYISALVDPIEDLPAPQILVTASLAVREEPQEISTNEPSATPLASPTPLPFQVSLNSPSWEKQDWNNCGPATLSMYLRYYGWEGDQFSISKEIKPERSDRNVNVDELIYFAQNWAGWLKSQFRVGGDIEMLKAFLSAGIPVMIEEGYILEESYWPNDDQWAGHYLLVTGYDESARIFTAQDTFIGADRQLSYELLNEGWQQFNRVFLLLYLPHQEEIVRNILLDHWDVDFNREHALEVARQETIKEPDNAFAWFNVGMNLVHFERYSEAAEAFDMARSIGLPQRMLRYQFGPFFAYFHTNRMEDLDTLVDYALRITNVSEEAQIWKGWSLYRNDDTFGAIEEFRIAYSFNPKSFYVAQALDFFGASP